MSVALKDAVEQMQESLRSNPDSALAKFSADSRQVQGLQSETKIRQFTLTVDEPESLGGTDTGPNPVELILGALASCQEITYRAFAEALEIPLDSVSVRIEGDLYPRDGINYLVVHRVLGDEGVVKLTHDDYGIQPFGE